MVLIVSFSCRISPFTSSSDLRLEITTGDGRGHVRDVKDLAGQIRRHGVDVVGEILPCAHTGHLRLTAKFSVGANLARHAADFCRKAV